MRVSFLAADCPLTKKYTAKEKIPYPNVSVFTSYEHTILSLAQFANLIEDHARQGHCLLKGMLDRPLIKESRAGHTNSTTPTQWICLDLDGMSSVSSIEDFMAKAGLGDVSYILQWSASYGVYNNFALRAHIFLLLDSAVHPPAIKVWLKQLNLTVFKDDLRLARGSKALIWGLDITTCQNDKLLFITEPECKPPSLNKFQGDRIEIIKKQTDVVVFNSIILQPINTIAKLESLALDTLREAAGEPKLKAFERKLKTTFLSGDKGEKVDYMPSPNECFVSSSKSERGFTYLNLNGGDSWGYYHPDDNPKFIHNFKGEPLYLTKELVPDYWEDLQKQKSLARAQAKQALVQATKHKVFLAFQEKNTACYYTAIYDATTDTLDLSEVRTEKQINNFLVHHGQPEVEHPSLWELTYDPQAPTLDLLKLQVNTYQASTYKKQAKLFASQYNPKTSIPPAPTPTIDYLLLHVLGNNPTVVDYFKNWLAFCFKNMTFSGTGWIFHGVQGTGKGALFNNIITPLFGESNVTSKGTHVLEETFNHYLENKIICFIDEVQVSESSKAKSIMEKIKMDMVSPRISIRRMRTNHYETANFTNWIFASNMHDPLILDKGERRFNVGNRQETPIVLTDKDFRQIAAELQDFANYLEIYQIDETKVRKPLENEAKELMTRNSQSTYDEITDILKAGHLQDLWDLMPDEAETLARRQGAITDPQKDMITDAYIDLIIDLISCGGRHLHVSELRTIFAYCTGNRKLSDKMTFQKSLAHKHLFVKSVRINGVVCKGYYVNWTTTPEDFEQLRQEAATRGLLKTNNVTPISSIQKFLP